jgi:cytochrome c oxidase assembly protein subunit 15
VLLLGGVLAAQLALGLANVYWQFPLAVAVAHNAMGAALLLAVINVLWRLQPLPATATAKATSVTTTNEVTA